MTSLTAELVKSSSHSQMQPSAWTCCWSGTSTSMLMFAAFAGQNTSRSNADVRSSLSQRTAKPLIHGFIMSKLEHCNALPYALSDGTVALLQRVQRAAARVETRSWKSDHVTPILRDLHWLRIRERTAYKILIMVYRAHNGSGPGYLAELIQPSRPRREIRSANESKFHTPRIN